MMIVLLLLTLCFLWNGAHAHAQATDNATSNFQFDVLFPQANGVYRRISKFPLIFAMSGLEGIWQDRPAFEWSLIAALPSNDSQRSESWKVVDRQAWGGVLPYFNFSTSASANALSVQSSTAPWFSNSTQWQLMYRFWHYSDNNNSCAAVDLQNKRFQSRNPRWRYGNYFEGSFNFTINDDVPPYAFIDGQCGQALGALDFSARQQSTPFCPAISDSPPFVQSCRSRLNDTVFNQIRNTIGSDVNCGNVSSSMQDFNRTLCRGRTTSKSSAHPLAQWTHFVALVIVLLFSCFM